MRFAHSRPVVVVLVGLALAGPVNAQSFAWWKSEHFQRDLGLTTSQAAKIDDVYQATLPRLRQSKEELYRQEAELSRLIEANAEESQVARQVDRVEVTRGTLNKMRTLMLLHMNQLLTAEQRTRLKVVHEQWQRDHRQPPAGEVSKRPLP